MASPSASSSPEEEAFKTQQAELNDALARNEAVILQFAIWLLAKGIITEAAKMEASNQHNHVIPRANAVLTSCLSSVSVTPSNFHLIVQTLRDVGLKGSGDNLLKALIAKGGEIPVGPNGGAQAEAQAQSDTSMFTKWLKEGTVNLTVKRVQMLGPPGSGKTCSLHLLLNEDLHVTQSTSIVCRAVKATKILVTDGHMERVDTKTLLSRLADNLSKALIAKGGEVPSMQRKTPTEDHGTKLKEESAETIHTDSPKTKATESTDPTESSDDPNKKDIVEAIQEKAHLNYNWVYIVDSGGQPAFQELLPLFTRAASLNIITLDLSKGMNENLLNYRIGGETFTSFGSYSNFEFLRDELSSGAVLQPYHTQKSKEDTTTLQHPEHFFLGTHKDEATQENIDEYNKQLSSLTHKSEGRGYCIIPPEKNSDIMYPINAILSGSERQAEARNLCKAIFYDITPDDIIPIPIRWFLFELILLEKARDDSYLKIQDVFSIGRSLQMTDDDTKKALQYLHDVTIILYYSQVLPDIVFVDPHPILDILSRLLALTYKIDGRFLQYLTKKTPSLSELDNISEKGIFTKSLLDKLNDNQGFPKSDFIKLLLHLHIITETQDGYFIPSALPPYTGPPPDSDVMNPLLVVWQNPVNEEILPVPRGVFPLAIVNLMKLNQPQFRFPPLHQTYLRYRDAMSFRIFVRNEHVGTIHFIKKHGHIEISFTGHEDDTKYCPLITEAIIEAIRSSSVTINLKHLYKLAFACCSTENCYCIVTNEAEKRVACTLCPKRAIISGQEKYWNWFNVTHQNSNEGQKTYHIHISVLFDDTKFDSPLEETRVIVSDAHCVLDITHLRDVRLSLQKSNFNDLKWLHLGKKLGLLSKTLEAIEDKYQCVSRRLREMLVEWLEGADGVSPSWASLVQALDHEDIKENDAAKEIRCNWIKRKHT